MKVNWEHMTGEQTEEEVKEGLGMVNNTLLFLLDYIRAMDDSDREEIVAAIAVTLPDEPEG